MIKEYEGDTKAPNKMTIGSIYNLIEQLDSNDLSKERLSTVTNMILSINICDKARDILDHAIHLASMWKTERRDSVSEVIIYKC